MLPECRAHNLMHARRECIKLRGYFGVRGGGGGRTTERVTNQPAKVTKELLLLKVAYVT